MIQESNIVLKLHYCHKFRYTASFKTTSNKRIDEAYKQGRAYRHLINTSKTRHKQVMQHSIKSTSPAMEGIKP
jgi:hypothetical protein